MTPLVSLFLMAADFTPHTIATDLKGGYQVVAADLNQDGRPDLLALASGMNELVWFENPGWQRRVLATNVSRAINLAPWIHDGAAVIVLAQEFAMDPRKSAGIVSVLQPNGDPRQPWSATEIDRLPGSHRLRWADLDGSGRKVCVNAPLAGAASAPPDYKQNVPLVFYRPPRWQREIVSNQLQGVMHGLFITDWDGDGRDEVLTASFEGIHLFKLGRNGRWSTTQLARGSPLEWPKCGASEIAVGHLDKQRFLAAIEPWHGNQVVVYRRQGGAWQRQVLDDSLVEGHALNVADLDGDGRDEIVAGYRGNGRSVYIYTAADASGARWTRRALDAGGMGAASCAVADLNGDGRPDLACIDSTTLKWYENSGPK